MSRCEILGTSLMLALFLVGCKGADQSSYGPNPPEGGSLPAAEDYYDAAVLDPDHIWVVGSYGTILRVSQGGDHVELQSAGTRAPLFCVNFRDTSNGLAAGPEGLVLRTSDGGTNWERARLPETAQYNVLAMTRGADRRRVWAVGPQGMIVRSADDGMTWEDLSLGRDVTLNAVNFLNDTDGWLVGEFGTILRTTDGGKTWEARDQVFGLPEYPEKVTEEEALRLGIPRIEKDELYFFDVAFSSAERGYIVGAGGFVLETADGGARWNVAVSGTRDTLFGLAIPPSGSLVAVGIVGTLLQHDGTAWRPRDDVARHVLSWLRSVEFAADGAIGVATGGNGTILLSRDRGASWTRLAPTAFEQAAGADALRRTASASASHFSPGRMLLRKG